ncbi:MAG: hypothetical protein HOI35_14005 [Woeseia sp.]|jgi:hypothetical protein|nr:hypothetical protein [Woeseia sp.]MBT6211117.1 hypothetical protein [Woeseia sp.]
MNFPGNFLHIADVDTWALKQLLLGLDDEQWQSEAFRQQRYEVHRDTQTINLVFDPDFRHTHPTKLPMLRIFEDSLLPVLSGIAGHYDLSEKGQALGQSHGRGYFVRANLVKLKVGGEIPAHADGNFSLAHSHRIHLPIVTNEYVKFTVGGEEAYLPDGALYEINNRRKHHVVNSGPEDRVHLIVDYVLPGEKCCCGDKLHPETACNPQACMFTDQFKIPCTCMPE